jgi:hypothetical protein
MEAILARRFAPFNFSVVSGFPNVVPTMDEWGDFLPIFREHKEDNPAQHLREFHELMHQWEIHHEDVLMKMFVFSLDGDAREWYRSLPPASISSLEEFHAAFNKHCQRYYSSELICHNCCEEYRDGVRDIVVLESYEERCEDEGHPPEELMELVKSLSARMEKLEADRACCSYEEAEDIPVLETDVLGSPTYDEEVISDTDQEEQLLMNIPMKMTKRRALPWFLFIMIVNLILGRAMKEKRKSQRGSLPPVRACISVQPPGPVSLHRLFTHLCLPEIFIPV